MIAVFRQTRIAGLVMGERKGTSASPPLPSSPLSQTSPSPFQDVLFGGRISLNLPDQQVEYSKRVRMPNGSQIVFAGSCSYRGRRLEPNFGVQLQITGDTAAPFPTGHTDAVWVGNTFEVRQRFSVAKGLGVEVCGGVSLPTPAARYSHAAGTLSLGEGAFHLHVAEVNAVLRL